MKPLVILPCVIAILFSVDVATADGPAVTQDEVLAMMARVPGKNAPGAKPYAWDRRKHAPKIAAAIAQTAPTREWARRMVVYAVRESGLEPCAVGDGGKALGVWQLQGVGRTVACEPIRALPIWLRKAQRSIEDCAKLKLPEDEQLAELLSGSCGLARKLSADREKLAREIEEPAAGVE